MNRRTQLKIEDARIFAKKYIFSGRFIVRNTLVALGLATVVGSTALTVNVANTRAALKAEENKTISSMVADNIAGNIDADNVDADNATETKGYTVFLTDSSVLASDSVDDLYVRFEDEGVLTATNSAETLTQSEIDMTGKYIVATDGLNLRAEASQEGNILLVLNTGDTGEVIGTDGDWTIVAAAFESEDGTVTSTEEGYVKTEFILTGAEATEVAEQAAKDGKTYRDVIGVPEQQTVVVADAKTDDTTKLAETTKTVDTNTTQINETAKQTTEAPTQAATETTTQAPTEAATEAPTEAVTEAPTEVVTEAPTEAATEAPATQVASSDLYLLAAIVYAESGGESYEGQLAVANVVLNRVYSGAWGGSSISAVVYAPNQFSAIYTSAFQNALSTGGSSTSLQAAQDALNGANNIGGYTSFRPTWNIDTSTLGSYQQIGNHIFF